MRWLLSLLGWPRHVPAPRTDLHVILYTRSHCPLCDEAASLLERYRQRYGFSLEAKDVDAAAELVAAHGNWIPVVTINGKLRFRGHVNEVLLQRILEAKVDECWRPVG